MKGLEEMNLLAMLRPSQDAAINALRDLARHVAVLKRIDAACIADGSASHTTPRFRYELLYYLLDNRAQGPILEVGTMNGGMTALFGYAAEVTGRKVFAIDLMGPQISITERTCRKYNAAKTVTFFTGTLNQFVSQGLITERPDLVFIDADHSYNSTLGELRALYGQPNIPRCTAMHDFNYRQMHQIPWMKERGEKNPIAVDYAVFDFFSKEYTGPAPLMKRLGAFSGDGTVGTRKNKGGLGSEGDFVEDFGTEGLMLFHP